MADGRSGKPLYELMREPPGRGVPAPAGDRLPEGQAEPSPPRAPEHAPPRTAVSVPLPTLYIAIGLMIVLCVLSWAGGYTLGTESGKSEILRSLEPGRLPGMADDASGGTGRGSSDPDLTVVDPLREPDRGFGSTGGQADLQTSPQPRPVGDGSVLTPRGWAATDPRLAGHNYLELATLPEADAIEALRVLQDAGVSAIAVAAEGGRFRVVSLAVAVPSSRYSASAGERRAHEQQVRAIGDRWQGDGGASNFARTQWRRHDP
ncbi:MAG: hypothetical protein AAF356_11065 [Planctomycetota bacterium]